MSSRKFTSLIIGDGTLPVRCGEILLRGGHEIYAVVSTDRELKKWAKQNEIALVEPGPGLEHRIGRRVDYLFSIVNERILRQDVLDLADKLAINYHDAPLPRYAGTHATSWALMNGETVHGVSWHVITDTVDAGDILKQREVEISDKDTAFTLNTKCYEAAAVAFEELITELAAGSISPRKQETDKRTFFPRFKRPAGGGVISWDSSASEISALARALDFGNHPNPLGSAKLIIEDEFLIVSDLAVLDVRSTQAPGTIIDINDQFVQVSTNDKDVAIRHLRQICGEPASIADLTTKFQLNSGYRLTQPGAEFVHRFDAALKKTAKSEKFWVDRLSKSEPGTVPHLNSTPDHEKAEYAFDTVPIPPEVVSVFGNSAVDVILCAFGALVARLGTTDRFDIGYFAPELVDVTEGLDDLFVRQVPLRFDIDGSQDIWDLLGSMASELNVLTDHSRYQRDLAARFPQLGAGSRLNLPLAAAKVECFENYQPADGNALTLLISENRSEVHWVYDRTKISRESFVQLRGNFETLLSSIIAAPNCPLFHQPIITEQERRQLICEWNDNHDLAPADKCVHQLFEEQVARTPEAAAVLCDSDRVTYQELNDRANRLASYLHDLDVRPDTLVGICVSRSVDMIVGILGVLKAGGAYVPMDPAYPSERIEYILGDSQAPILLTQGDHVDKLAHYQGKIVRIDTGLKYADLKSKADDTSLPRPGNLAYVIYTSGSTGRPKGVAIEHRSAVTLIQWAKSVYSVEQLKGVLASTSICFDLSIFEMFAPLSVGGTVVLVENILHLKDSEHSNAVTLINTVPSAITELLRSNGVPASVCTVNLAGEPLKTSLVKQIYGLGTVQAVFDLYGPSEDTTYSTFALRDSGLATIGRPISNTQAYILDRYLEPVPIGIPGELYLGGDGLARGYLNRPELTAERFINNPFSDDPTARIYKTGDLVRYLPSGQIEYLGRIDNQVKIRGFRIEIGEVEAILLSHPSVDEAVVVARDDGQAGRRLIAYVIPSRQVNSGELREYLKQKLPEYMVPSVFVELEELPLTPNGKVDRRALPAPPAINDVGGGFVKHRDDVERRLVEIWETLLGVCPIGINDNFFDLGGHSLQAIRMFSQVEETFGKNIPLATLFEAGTIEKLAAIVRHDGWAEPESCLVPIQPNGTKPPFFCVHAKGGNVLFYRDLAKYLGTDQPFFGIQARRLGGRQVGHGSVEEMAEYYIKEIRQVQPMGPYFLGGSSFGGLGALEIAQQLNKQGEQVALLALMDTGTPDYPKLLPGTSVFKVRVFGFARRIQHHWDSLSVFDSKERRDYAIEKLKKVRLKYRRRVNNAYKKAVRKFYVKVKGTGTIPSNYIQIEDQIWKAGQKYSPKPYPGKITLFRASNQPLGIVTDPTLGWDGIPSELEMFEVPGHHGSIVTEPYVRTLAERLKGCIESAQGREARFDTDAGFAAEKVQKLTQTV